jgi:hypothetical protein
VKKAMLQTGVLVWVGLIVPLGGCSGTARPTATVTDATIRDRSADAAVVEFVIEAANPNDIELPMREVVYTLSVDGKRVFSGKRDAQATMPRAGMQTIRIPAVVPLGEGGLTADLHRYTLRGTIYYSLPSQLADVLFDAKLSRPSVGVADEGEIDLR